MTQKCTKLGLQEKHCTANNTARSGASAYNLKRESSTNKGRNQQCCHRPPTEYTAKGNRLEPSSGSSDVAMPKLLLNYSPPEQSTITLVGVLNAASPIHRQTEVCWFRPWVKPPGIFLNRSIPAPVRVKHRSPSPGAILLSLSADVKRWHAVYSEKRHN